MKMIDCDLLRGKITAMQSTNPEYAYNFLNNAQNPSTEWECIEDMLDNMEVYEAEPVKRGKWSKQGLKPDGFGGFRVGYICSACKEFIPNKGNFCSNCGADMRGGAENDD